MNGESMKYCRAEGAWMEEMCMSRFQKGDTVFLKEDFAGHSEDSDHEVLDVDDDAEEPTYFIFNDSFGDCFDVAVPESKLLSVDEYRLKLTGKRRTYEKVLRDYAKHLADVSGIGVLDITVSFSKHWWE